MVNAKTFDNFAAECQYLHAGSCTRPRKSFSCPGNTPCAYESCGLLAPTVRPRAEGGYVVSLVEELGRTAIVAGPFDYEYQAKDMLKQFRTRAAAIEAVMSQRS
jgi:hypothetical protein